MKGDEKKPKIRFKGYINEWENRELSNLLVLLKDGTHGTHKDVKDGAYLLSAKNIKDGEIYIDDSDRKISFEEFQKIHSHFTLQKGDVLVTIVGTIGETAIMGNMENITFQRSVAYLRTGCKLYNYFLLYEIATQRFQFELENRRSVSAQPGIYLGELARIPINYPGDITEQEKIGCFLNDLDNIITLQQQKYNQLVNMKSSLLEKMFPHDGAKVPEIRFDGFTDDWKQYKLFDCVNKIVDFRGRTPKKLGMEWSDSGFMALSALNVKDGYIDFTQDPHYGDQQLYNIWMKGNELHRGQVLFTTEAPMGNVAQIPDNRQYILSQRTIAFEVNSDVIQEDFLAVLLRSPSMIASLKKLMSGGTAKGVSQKSLSLVSTILPSSKDEQQKISKLFNILNSLVIYQQQKIDCLRNIKQSFLDKMFVS